MAQISEAVIPILEARYLQQDESPEGMFKRVAEYVSSMEKEHEKYRDEFFNLMNTLEFLPNSPTLMNAGKPEGQLSACFSLPLEDSMMAIMNCVKYCALIHKTGGGSGICLDKIRPEGSIVGSTKGVASGPVSFLRIFDTMTDVVKQGGVRRGANIAVMRVTHPDIEKFIDAKLTGGLTNFNLSVLVNDEFMRRAVTGRQHHLIWQGDVVAKTNAEELLRKIALSTWRSGDPGIIFIDEINRHNPTPWMGKIHNVNPCGEQPLFEYESCNLGSIDVSKFANSEGVDYKKLNGVVELAVRFLDDVIETNSYPNVKIKNKTLLTRKIGLGVMGFADLLISLNIEYGSKDSIQLAEELMSFISMVAVDVSRGLARERGLYPAYRKSNGHKARRHATLTTIAPTGTLSLLAGCSSGIEPVYDKSFSKLTMGNHRIDFSEKYRDKDVKTALEIPYKKHIDVQAAFQKHCDNAVSKTINMRKSSTKEDVFNAYVYAWESKVKGVTIFRDGSKEGTLRQGELSECDSERCTI